MKLGEAIPPRIPETERIVSDGESAAVLRELLSGLADVTQQLVIVTARVGALVDQHQGSAESLASAARSLASRSVLPAPEVNVTVPAALPPSVEVPVTVTPAPEVERKRKTRVVRNADGLITELVEEAV